MIEVLERSTSDLPADLHAQARRMMDLAFGDDPEEAFGDDDWDHALGGVHVVVVDDGLVVAHAALVERTLHAGTRALRTGYVEAVATAPDRQGEGHGSLAVGRVTELVRARFELGALGTGRWSFYERLGWERWEGPTYVRTAGGALVRTEEDDDGVMVLRTGPSARPRPDGPACVRGAPRRRLVSDRPGERRSAGRRHRVRVRRQVDGASASRQRRPRAA